VSQHCDEMGGPDTATGRRARSYDPGSPPFPCGVPRATKQIDGAQAGTETHDSGDNDQTPVMLIGQAINHLKYHTRPPQPGGLLKPSNSCFPVKRQQTVKMEFYWCEQGPS